jgi:hypothetical protein
MAQRRPRVEGSGKGGHFSDNFNMLPHLQASGLGNAGSTIFAIKAQPDPMGACSVSSFGFAGNTDGVCEHAAKRTW